jgi:hypothetical protein
MTEAIASIKLLMISPGITDGESGTVSLGMPGNSSGTIAGTDTHRERE